MPAQAMMTLKSPTHVEAYRTGKLEDHPGYGGKMDGFGVIRTGHLDDDSIAALSQTIADPDSYFDAARPDEFVPDIGYRFYRHLDHGRGQMSLDVLLDFDLDEVLLVARDNKLHEVFRRILETDRSREKLLEITRQAFPFDELVQSLSEIRPTTTQEDGD
jgi:hypothetical protein